VAAPLLDILPRNLSNIRHVCSLNRHPAIAAEHAMALASGGSKVPADAAVLAADEPFALRGVSS
jgi:hypothetical protein